MNVVIGRLAYADRCPSQAQAVVLMTQNTHKPEHVNIDRMFLTRFYGTVMDKIVQIPIPYVRPASHPPLAVPPSPHIHTPTSTAQPASEAGRRISERIADERQTTRTYPLGTALFAKLIPAFGPTGTAMLSAAKHLLSAWYEGVPFDPILKVPFATLLVERCVSYVFVPPYCLLLLWPAVVSLAVPASTWKSVGLSAIRHKHQPRPCPLAASMPLPLY